MSDPRLVPSELVWIFRKKPRPAVVLTVTGDQATVIPGTGSEEAGTRATVELDSYEGQRLSLTKTTHFYAKYIEQVPCRELRPMGLRCPRRLLERLRALEPTHLGRIAPVLVGSHEVDGPGATQESRQRRGS
jgi:hypothetical protein